ncbi:hypothetical protein QUF58_04920 [Anaerolineales bacterium HSG24]|nr:hypothetical protein [Anaerolineales bacterium HSG24]
MTSQPFIQLSIRITHPILRFSFGWLALAGIITSSHPLNPVSLSQILLLWLLIEPLWGTLWSLGVNQRMLYHLLTVPLPAPVSTGFTIPYAQHGSVAGQLVIWIRRQQAQTEIAQQAGLVSGSVIMLMALLLSFYLSETAFLITLLAIVLMLMLSLTPPAIESPSTSPTPLVNLTPYDGLIEAIVQVLLPWLMGLTLFAVLSPFGLAVGLCLWLIKVGAVRLAMGHHQADKLFLGAQLGLIGLIGWAGYWGVGFFMILLLLYHAYILQIEDYRSQADFVRLAEKQLLVGLLLISFAMGG